MKTDEELIEELSVKLANRVQELADERHINRPFMGHTEALSGGSVIQIDPYLRSIRPFVRLGSDMEDFIRDVRSLARTGMAASVVKSLAEDDDTTGGFLVPPEFMAEVTRYATENAVVRPRARVFSMRGAELKLPKLDQSSDKFGGVDLFWIEEAATKTESQPVFGKLTLKAKKLIGLCVCSDELLEDSAVNLANYLVGLFGEAINYEEDYRFLRGTGMGQPLGILSAVGINVIGRETSSKITLEDILGMYASHPAWADGNAVWITTKNGLAQLMRIGSESTSGITLFMLNLREKVTPTLQGKEIILTDKLPALGSKGDIILGDLKYYYIGDRGGMQITSSIHDRFRNDEVTFRFVKRVDGQPAIPSAFTVLSE